MASITFDTLQYSRELQEGGFTREQADALAKAQAKASEVSIQDLVTSAEFRAETKVTRWMVGISIALNIAILGIVLNVLLSISV